MSPIPQTVVIAALLSYDIFFLYNLYDYRKQQHSDELYRPVYGFDDLRVVAPHLHLTMVVHVLLGILPLLLSLIQCAKAVRSRSIDTHRVTGRICLASALLSSIPSLRLASSIADNGPVENALVVALGVAWIVAALQTWRCARAKAITKHRSWGVRFTVLTHVVPVGARIAGVPLWMLKGRPKWSLDPIPASSDPSIFPAITWIIAASILPAMEMFVHLEVRGIAKSHWSDTF